MKVVSKKDLVLLAVILTGFLVYAVPRFILKIHEGSAGQAGKKEGAVYYCPMHPTYTSDHPGDCPICNMKLVAKPSPGGQRKILYYRHPMGQPDISPVPKKDTMGMDYIPVYEDESRGIPSQVRGHATVPIPPEKQQLIGVKLGKVEKSVLAKEIRTVGRVAYDPVLYTAQQEFLAAVQSLKKAKGGPYHEPLERTESFVASIKLRLRILGMSEEEIAELETNALQDQNLILPGGPSGGPLSSVQNFVWVYATIYEHEISWIRVGTEIKVLSPAFPEKEFSGKVVAADPILDAQTRSIRIRARVSNPEGILKPEMYVDVYFKAEAGEGLVVPKEAVLFTGERNLVFVSSKENYFEPREVKLGAETGNFYEVKSGLAVGESVVVSGNFLIDSESRLQAAFQGMGGEGGGHPLQGDGPPGDQHAH